MKPKRMRGTVHICGRADLVDCTFEHPPQPNPPLETYYRRAVYQLALDRLNAILDTIKAADTKSTGRAFRNVKGDVIGRGKGIMPSLAKTFPELRYWTKGPAELRRTIERANTPAYFDLLQGAVNQVEGTSGEQLELFVRQAPRSQLNEFPPVTYPAHKGTKRCKNCKHRHSSTLHRFHLPGSYDRTHPGPERAAVRKKEREAKAARLRDEVPF